MGSDPALSRATLCDPSEPSADDNSFRFTPIKALRAIPRLWERKPATPFKSGLKRKLWKRFQTSFSNMQTLESSTATDDVALQTAINISKDSSYVRGVKRLCVGPGEFADKPNVGQSQPERSFLETKWESEASRKRRKLPDAPFEVYDEGSEGTSNPINDRRSDAKDIHYDLDADGDLAMATASPILFKSLRSPPEASIFQDIISTEEPTLATEETEHRSINPLQRAMVEGAVLEVNGDVAATPTKTVRNLTQAQEGTLVRSALRSSLDGEDAMLLNDFLSKAMAKRVAKAALVNTQESDTTDQFSSSEESPDAESATPRSRTALGDRDANSASPVKALSSPSKINFVPGDESCEKELSKDTQDEEETAPESPAHRRSARVKAPPANARPVRNTIALRRAKGNEFVFMQRTEAQELALTTRRNTRNNRGSSVMPKYVLQAMAQEDATATASDILSQSRADRKTSGSRKAASKSRKNVTWNEERMVEYEGDISNPLSSDADSNTHVERDESSKDNADEGSARAPSKDKRTETKVLSSNRSSRSQAPEKEKAEADAVPTAPANAAAPVSSTSKSRRVRRLGDSAMTSGTPVKTGSGRISKPPTTLVTSVAPAAADGTAGPSTPTKPRRKLVPKSPSSSLLSVPAVKASSGTGGEQHFVSGIPTRSTVGSERTKRKSMVEANAGCTPMPRRVRARP